MLPKKSIGIVFMILLIVAMTPAASAASYSISIQDVTITPDDLDIGDTVKIKVQYRISGPSDPETKLYLYIDGSLKKTYTRTYSYAGTYTYTFYFDSDELEDRKHEIKIIAKVYDRGSLRDTDTYTQNIYFNDDGLVFGLYNIDIQEIKMTPSDPHVGDTVRLTSKFYITSPGYRKVRLTLYIDGKEEETYTSNYNQGTRYHTFSFPTSSLEKGSHTAKVKAEIYRDYWIKDTDMLTESFYLRERRDITHDIDITSINYNTPVGPGDRIPVSITVRNSGNTDEENVKIKLILDSRTAYSAPFYLMRDQSKTKTVYIDTPSESGRYELVISAYNENAEQKNIELIQIHGYSLSMSLTPEDFAETGEWIKVSGYARQDGGASTKKINIYRDNRYEKTIIPEETGYYSDYIMFDTAGYHSIKVELENIIKEKTLMIKQKEITVPPPSGSAPIYVGKDQSYTIIIIKEGKERIYIQSSDIQPPEQEDNLTEIRESIESISSEANRTNTRLDTITSTLEGITEKISELGAKIDSAKEKEDDEEEFKYVDIETSNKELVVKNFGSNIVSIRITNHLGRKERFRIETDFNENWVFLPKSEIIDNRNTKTFYIHFNPTGEKGEHQGNLIISSGDEIVKEIPLTLYVTDKTEPKPPKKEFIGPDTLTGAFIIIALFAIIMIGLYYTRGTPKTEKRPLEPKIIPAHIGRFTREDSRADEKKRQEQVIFSRTLNHAKEPVKIKPEPSASTEQVYHVGWNQVIM